MSRTRFISRLGAVLLAAALLAPGLGVIPAQAAVETRIYTVEDLWGIGNDPGGTYTLMNDLDLSGWNGGWWMPIEFSGTFYGGGHTISGLRVRDEFSAGLFGLMHGTCTVTDLTVRLETMENAGFGGILAAEYVADEPGDSLTLRNCTAVGNVTVHGGEDGLYGAYAAGGLVGRVYFQTDGTEAGALTLTGCRVEGDVSARDSRSEVSAGGLVGGCDSGVVTVSGCSYAGEVRSSHRAGGLFGYIYIYANRDLLGSGSISGCVVEGSVTARNDGAEPCQLWAGGLIGYGGEDLAAIRDCSVFADVTAESDAPPVVEFANVEVGGLSAESNLNQCAVSGCVVAGDLYARGPGASVQGMGAGVTYENCSVTGTISALADVSGYPADAGGIAIYGGMPEEEGSSRFSGCTVDGAVSAESLDGDAYAGGIVAAALADAAEYTDCVTYGAISAVTGGSSESVSGIVHATAAGIAGGNSDRTVFTRCRSYGDVTALGPNGANCSAAGIALGFLDPTNRLESCSAAGAILASIPSTASRHAWMETAGLLQGAGANFHNCSFTGTAVNRYSDTGREGRDSYAFSDEPSTITGAVRNTSGLDLCPGGAVEDPGPELPQGAEVVTGSAGAADYGQTAQTYYSRGDHYFRVLVPGDTYPQTGGFTISIGEAVYDTGTRNDLRVDIPADYAGDVVISKEGFHTYTLPNQYLRKYNWIVLWPEEAGSTRPVIQSVLRESAGSVSNYLLSQASTPIYTPDTTLWTVDVQVDWQGREPGEVWLQQGDRRVDVTDGTTGPVPLGTRFTAEGGTIYACARNAEGELTKVTTTLKVRSKSVDVELDVGEPKEVTSTDNVDFLANRKVEFDLPGILEAEMSINADGTFTALLGLKSKDKLYHKQAVGGIAELLDTINSEGVGVDVDSALEKLFRETEVIPTAQSAKFSIPVSLSVYGYLEGCVAIRNGALELEITEGGTLFKGSGGWSYTQLFPSGTYVQTGLTNSTQIKMVWSNGAQEPVTLKNTTSVKIGGGLGIPDIFSVGASGTGSLIFELTIPMGEDWDLYATYSFAVGEVSALGYKLTIHTYESDKYYWVRDGKFALGEREPQARMAQVAAAEEDDFVPIPRDYLDRRGLKLLDASDVDAPFRDNVLPGAAVQLAALPDGSLLAVWADDPGMETRPLASNRSALYYSLWKNGSWSQPALVEDDGTADYSPVLRVLDGTAYLAWMNAGHAFTAETSGLEETAAAMDIRFAAFDEGAGGFGQFATVSAPDYGVLDMLPDILLLENGPAVVWLAETANDLYNRSGTGSLYAAACMDGQWQAPQPLSSGLSGVDSLTAGSSDGFDAQVWYSAGDPDDPESKDIYTLSFFPDGSGGLITNPAYPYTDNAAADTKPYWTEDGLSYYSGGAIQTPWGETGADLPGDQYCLVTGDGTQAILYTQAGEDGTTSIYALFQDGGGWSQPVAAAQGGLLVPSLDGAFDQDGNLHVFYSSVDVLQENADGSVETKTSLHHGTLAPSADLAVTYADYQTASLIPGGALHYFVTVENRGTRSANYLQAEVFQGETSLGTTVFLDSLPAGGTQTFSGSCTLPADYAGEDLTITVTALDEGFDQENLTDNTARMDIFPADVSVEEAVAVQMEDGKVLVTALAANYGLTAAENLTVSLEDQDGQVLKSQSIGALAPGGVAGVEFLSDQLQPDGLYVLTITEQPDERVVADNRCPFLVMGPEQGPAGGLALSQSSCRFEEDGILLQAVVENSTESGVSGTLVAALYCGDRLLETRQAALAVDGGGTVRSTLAFDPPAGDCRVKLFFLEQGTAAPLVEAVSFQSR